MPPVCTCPKTQWNECVLLHFSVVLNIPFTEIGGQATVVGGVVHSWGWGKGGVALSLRGGWHQPWRCGWFVTRAGCWWWVWRWWRWFVDLKKKRNKKKEKKKIHIYFLIYTLNKKNTQKKPTINSKNHLVLDCTKIFLKKIEEHTHTSLNALLTFMCFRRELGCV